MDQTKMLEIGLPIVLSALLATVSALIKTSVDRRDARRTAHRQLELATIRTSFVKEWLEVSRSLGGDAEYMEAATDKALQELDEAYADAQLALADGKSALADSAAQGVIKTLRRFLMLVPRKRPSSYVVVALFYFFVASIWVGAFAEDPTDPEPLSLTENLVYGAGFTIFLRVAMGAFVTWLERRASSPAEGGEAAAAGADATTESDAESPTPLTTAMA